MEDSTERGDRAATFSSLRGYLPHETGNMPAAKQHLPIDRRAAHG
jgi:hypothetical protein